LPRGVEKMKEIFFYIAIFYFGAFMGFLLKSWLVRRADYSGTIFVNKSEGKTLYSLVLNDYPELIEFQKVVIFKVEVPEKSSDRE
jgi:hypothetical protein